MPPETLEQRIITVNTLGNEICQAMIKAVNKMGFSDKSIPDINFDNARFELHTDAYTQQQALMGIWYFDQHRKAGEIIFHVDGSFYAEYDVVLPHPQDARWFVESITAWGRDGKIKTDAKLLAMQQA